MALGAWVVFGWMAFVGLTIVAFIVYAVKSGQLKDIEEAKYKMLEDREPEPWPGQEQDGTGGDR
jgi:nitrogen fixation-related uncharacterized protein